MKGLFVRRSGDGDVAHCSFCGKEETRRRKVTRRADGLFICNDCADRVIDALSRSDIEKQLTR